MGNISDDIDPYILCLFRFASLCLVYQYAAAGHKACVYLAAMLFRMLQVLDEMMRVLRALSDVNVAPRTHELLQELRDISSMAMEHFDDKIVPILRGKMPTADCSISSISISPLPMSSPLTPTSKHNTRPF